MSNVSNRNVSNRVVLVGLGGIGSWLLQALLPTLEYSGEEWSLLLVDGDRYAPNNLSRQAFDAQQIGKNKAAACAYVAGLAGYTRVLVFYEASYVDENRTYLIGEGDIVLLAVDNHKTRNLVSRRVEELQNAVLISGGNDLYDGNVQVFIRRNGKSVTTSLTDRHAEIRNPTDKAPFEMSCEELARSEPQVLATNLLAAALMLCAFRLWAFERILPPEEACFDTKALVVQAKPAGRTKEKGVT